MQKIQPKGQLWPVEAFNLKPQSFANCACLLDRIRLCVRRKFLNFLFPRVSEKFVFSKFRNFLEITVFFELAKILQKKFGKKYGNNFLFFGQKTLFLGQKVWKKFGKVQKKRFPNIRNLRKFRKLFYSKLSKNYEKMTLNSNFENREKLIPTWKPTRKFG